MDSGGGQNRAVSAGRRGSGGRSGRATRAHARHVGHLRQVRAKQKVDNGQKIAAHADGAAQLVNKEKVPVHEPGDEGEKRRNEGGLRAAADGGRTGLRLLDGQRLRDYLGVFFGRGTRVALNMTNAVAAVKRVQVTMSFQICHIAKKGAVHMSEGRAEAWTAERRRNVASNVQRVALQR